MVGGRDDDNDLNLVIVPFINLSLIQKYAILIFFVQNTIYQYDQYSEDWVLRDESLLLGRGTFGMVLVGQDSVNC